MEVVRENPEILLRLLEISRQLASEPDTDLVLQRIMDTAIEFLGAERGFLCLLDAEHTLNIVVGRNFDHEEVQNAQRKLSTSIVQKVMQTGEPIASMDAGEDVRLSKSRSIHEMKIRSVACIPLKLDPAGMGGAARDRATDQQIIGCVYLDHRFQPAQFLDADIELLEIFGAHAALAVKNAQLLAALEEKNAHLNVELEDSARQLLQTRSLLKDALAEVQDRHEVPGIVYASRAMHEILGLVKRVADRDLPILISGESGTGKELLARAIHLLSHRRGGPFVPVNCGAIPADLFESELFGHRKGAFTGADRDRRGMVEAAHHGTLFLDEVSELPLQHQVKLLRVLQEKEVRRVGEDKARSVDFRVLAATNKPLLEEVEAGRFREDLFYRLRVFNVDLPPLRERPEDIPLLVDRLVSKHKAITSGGYSMAELTGAAPAEPPIQVDAEVYSLFANYTWPGNIRELENEVKRALALSQGAITTAELSRHILGAPKRLDSFAALREGGRTLDEILAVVEREVISQTLDKYEGNKSKTAHHLGISRNGLAMKMERLAIEG